jgi:hypothetical protein
MCEARQTGTLTQDQLEELDHHLATRPSVSRPRGSRVHEWLRMQPLQYNQADQYDHHPVNIPPLVRCPPQGRGNETFSLPSLPQVLLDPYDENRPSPALQRPPWGNELRHRPTTLPPISTSQSRPSYHVQQDWTQTRQYQPRRDDDISHQRSVAAPIARHGPPTFTQPQPFHYPRGPPPAASELQYMWTRPIYRSPHDRYMQSHRGQVPRNLQGLPPP